MSSNSQIVAGSHYAGQHLSARQWWATFTAWVYLVTAAIIFASVVTAPKLLTRALLEKQITENQLKLVLLEQQVERTKGVATALKRDPKFAAALAQNDFANHLEPSNELVPMPPELSVDLNSLDAPYDIPAFPLPWYTGTLRELTFNKFLTRILLSVAALLTLLSFITTSAAPEKESEGSVWERLGERYGAVPKPKFASRSEVSRQEQVYSGRRSDLE